MLPKDDTLSVFLVYLSITVYKGVDVKHIPILSIRTQRGKYNLDIIQTYSHHLKRSNQCSLVQENHDSCLCDRDLLLPLFLRLRFVSL